MAQRHLHEEAQRVGAKLEQVSDKRLARRSGDHQRVDDRRGAPFRAGVISLSLGAILIILWGV
jgi:hypothetical protein